MFPALITAIASAADEKLPPNAKVLRLDARPSAIELTQPFAYAQLVVTAQLDGGGTADVTRLAAVSVPGVVKVSPTGLVRPAANGTGELPASIGGASVAIPVRVSGVNADPPGSFVTLASFGFSRRGFKS